MRKESQQEEVSFSFSLRAQLDLQFEQRNHNHRRSNVEKRIEERLSASFSHLLLLMEQIVLPLVVDVDFLRNLTGVVIIFLTLTILCAEKRKQPILLQMRADDGEVE